MISALYNHVCYCQVASILHLNPYCVHRFVFGAGRHKVSKLERIYQKRTGCTNFTFPLHIKMSASWLLYFSRESPKGFFDLCMSVDITNHEKNIYMQAHLPGMSKSPWVSRNSCTCWVPRWDVTNEGLSLQTKAGCRMRICGCGCNFLGPNGCRNFC